MDEWRIEDEGSEERIGVWEDGNGGWGMGGSKIWRMEDGCRKIKIFE